MNLPYFPPEDTSKKNLTDQLFKQQAIINDLLEALRKVGGLLVHYDIEHTKEAIEIIKQAIRKAEEQS